MLQDNVKQYDLSIKSDVFNALTSDFDAIMRKTIMNMETKDSEEAEITVKVKVSLKKQEIKCFNYATEGSMKNIIKPEFSHKVSSLMSIKNDLSGKLKGDFEIVYDKELGKYILRNIADGQVSIDDVPRQKPLQIEAASSSKKLETDELSDDEFFKKIGIDIDIEASDIIDENEIIKEDNYDYDDPTLDDNDDNIE